MKRLCWWSLQWSPRPLTGLREGNEGDGGKRWKDELTPLRNTYVAWPGRNRLDFGSDPDSLVEPGSFSRILYHYQIGRKLTRRSVSQQIIDFTSFSLSYLYYTWHEIAFRVLMCRYRNYSLSKLWTDFDEIFMAVGTGQKTSRLDFGGNLQISDLFPHSLLTFYRAMDYVCPSVTLMNREHMCWVSSEVITRIISLGSSLLGATTSAI